MKQTNNRMLKILSIVLMLSLFFVVNGARSFLLEKKLRVSFFDVGQGDAIFIQTPYQQDILIDGGPDARVLDKLGRSMPFWDRNIDVLILTHPHADHLVGLLGVLKQYHVEHIYFAQAKHETKFVHEWIKRVQEEGAVVHIVKSVVRIEFGNYMTFRIFPTFDEEHAREVNDTSLAARLVYGESEFLFMGDVLEAGERLLMEQGYTLKSDVLKVGHHGSRSSSGMAFLKRVSPKFSVISVGRKNRFGHPHEETLKRLQSVGSDVLLTSDEGDIVLKSDGLTVERYFGFLRYFSKNKRKLP